jgi:hypothetical protein
VLLDGFRFFSLANNFQKIIVGKEIETWEKSTFTLEELIEVLLDVFKLLV